MARRVTIRDIITAKAEGRRVPVVTAYDYTMGRQADEAGIPIVLVGDSLGMVVLGYDSTIAVTLEDMLHHVKAVVRGVRHALVVADLPFMTYQVSQEQALASATRLMQEGGAHSVKLEGGEAIAPTVRRIVECGIPVMGHVGLTPQSVHGLGGYRPRGRTMDEASQVVRDALALEKAGAYTVVLEVVPAPLSGLITRLLSIPTIGIGAGPLCDGQVQVSHDMLGLYTDFVPKHTKRYASLADDMRVAFQRFAEEVRQGAFPTDKESVSMDQEMVQKVEAFIGR